MDLQDNFAMIVKSFAFFLVLFFSLAFFEFFSKIIKLANTKFLSDSSIAQLRFDMYGKNYSLLAIRSIIIKYVYKVGFYDNDGKRILDM